MRRRFLIFWLILCILGYGLSLAADLHAGHDENDHPLAAEHQSAHDSEHESGCDHCCHGLMHLLGLPESDAFALISCHARMPSPYRVISTSSPPSTLFRPPIPA